jgi:hypothetical protein
VVTIVKLLTDDTNITDYINYLAMTAVKLRIDDCNITNCIYHAPPPRIRPTLASTTTRAVAIARPRGHFTSCAHHRFRRRRM